MILVQNHLQRLSGNNIVLFFAVFAMITSCAAGKKGRGNKNTIATEFVEPNLKKDTIEKKVIPFDLLDSEEEEINNNQKKDIKKTVEQKTKTQSKSEEINAKDKYRISVVLPFILNQIPLSGKYADDTTRQLLPESKRAMDFYLGCKIAYQEVNNFKKKLNVYFLDDNNKVEDIPGLLSGGVIEKSDYIIAPLEYNQVKTVADYGKANQKIVLSLSINSIYITRDNPYYYNVNPTLMAQYQFILDKIKETNTNTKLEVIYSSTDSISENISILKNIIAQNNKNENIIAIKYYDVASPNIVQQIYSTDTLSKRTVLIYSSNFNYIKSAINQLANVKNPLEIYTNISISNSKNLVTVKNFKHHLYSLSAYNSNNENTKLFKQKYIDNYVKEPTELSYLGYDLMKLLFKKIDKNEPLTQSSDDVYKEYLQQDFKFIPIFNSKEEIEYYDNAALNLLHYSNGIFVE